MRTDTRPGSGRRGRLSGGLGSRGVALLVLLLLAPTALTTFLRLFPQLDVLFESATFHIIVVSAIAGCALVVALATTVVAARARHPSLVLLAVGCLSVGVLMLGHGLTTPGILGRPVNMWVARFPVVAMALFSLCLAGVLTGQGSRVHRLMAGFPRAILVGALAVLADGTAAIVARPDLMALPFPGESLVSTGIVVASGVLFLVTGAMYWRRWRLGRDPVELALVISAWLSADALLSFQIGQLWHVSWWDYHAYLLAGFAAAAWAVLVGFRRTHSVAGAVASISVRDPLEHISRSYPEALHALVGAVEAKDRYTHGHSARVAELSTRIGLHMGLDPDTLRALSKGAVLHDIGKIGVPNEVLNKPASLTDQEWEWIRSHPVAGWEMASRASSLADALTVVRHHHERWDGSGYPDGLAGARIPLGARIATVADVWDALTSDRAYRSAWTPEEALNHLVAGRGSLFDPECVEAFVDMMSERGMTVGRAEIDRRVLAAAAEACHPGRSEPRMARNRRSR
ncbi:MAG TPA: HD domain-containing phosphohydrolase [Actinomycetota bacterium]|nr:HD domain-containing phosphohydrolase [Actinomycetota bacterium]